MRPSRLPVYRRRAAARVDTGTRQLTDCTRQFVPATNWLGGAGADARGNTERRAEDLVRGNRGLLADFHVQAEVGRVGGEPGLHLQTGARVGALPLRSPVSGRADFGLVISPRFPWSGVGDLLATTGFRIVPELLPLPELAQSERQIPPWVLASVVLQRLERLLDASARRFTTTEADRTAPHGQVDWTTYATRSMPVGKALQVPCRFPDLRDDDRKLLQQIPPPIENAPPHAHERVVVLALAGAPGQTASRRGSGRSIRAFSVWSAQVHGQLVAQE